MVSADIAVLYTWEMKKVLLLAIIGCPLLAFSQKVGPYMQDYGNVYPLEKVVMPDTGAIYKIVIDLKTSQQNPDRINHGLLNVARLINLHGVGGVPLDNLNVAVAIHGGATSVCLSDEAYNDRYSVNNPNLKLLEQLRKIGVEVFVCGQSLMGRDIERDEVNDKVDVALSMLTLATQKMNEGYSLMVFQ